MDRPSFVQASTGDHSKKDDTMKRVASIATGEIAEINAALPASKQVPELEADLQAAVNHRRLTPRQIQLTSIAGSIGAALFVAIGQGILSGPVCMLVAFIFWASVVFCVAQCQVEIVTLFPLDGSFIRLAGRMVDPSLGVAVGWNHFFAMTSYVVFEATIINTLVQYWGYTASPAILISVSLVFYLALNVYRVDLFGEAEFWLALGKVLLATGLICYTFVVMLGGNSLHDRFGFRYWVEPGPWIGSTPSEGLMSFVNAVVVAGFAIGGPEYISMIAGEAKDPRRTVPRAFNTIIVRLLVFMVGGALCVGILVPSNDPTLTNGSETYAGRSPYVISMQRLRIPVLGSIVNAALITCVISAGNAYTFNASRALHALALEGQAPKILRRVNSKGVPYLAVILVMLLGCLAFLALGSGSAQVLSWILNFCTAATMFNFSVMAMTYIRFQIAMKAQSIDRKTWLPTVSRWQPYASYWAFLWSFIFLWVQGYAVFLHGGWKVSTFIFNYGIIALAGGIGICWKIFKRTRFWPAKEVDLVSGLQFFEMLTEHYQQVRDDTPVTYKDKIMAALF